MLMNRLEFQRRLAQDPADMEAMQNLALILGNDGDGLQAMRLFHRARRLHGDTSAYSRQVGATLHVALNQISALLDPGHFDEAAKQLEWLASFIQPHGHLARLLGTVWLIQGREGEAVGLLPHLQSTGPRDDGLAVALESLDNYRRQQDVIGTVVIPAHRAAGTIVESLDSVLRAAAWHRRATGRDGGQIHIVVVDDGSPDDTVDVVRRWSRDHPDQGLTLLVHNRNLGASRARNAGVAAAQGAYLWFLDADDLFLERHIHLTASMLDHTPELDYVRTDMLFDRIDDQISPVWREASQRTYPCNLCIRREAHARTGGFPEEAPFFPSTADDVAYSRAVSLLLKGVLIKEKTVFYRMGDGNVLNRLQQEMISDRAPGEGAVVDARFMAIEILTRRRLYALKAGPETMGTRQADSVSALMTQAQARTEAADHPAALELLRRAIRLAPLSPAAWFELGMAALRLSLRAEAKTAFARTVSLRPDLSAARVNLGLLLLEEGAAADALPHLRRAVELAPANANARFLLGRAARQSGLAGEAVEQLRQAIALSPGQADYHAEWSGLLLDAGDGVAALAAADHALTLSSGLYAAHAARAAALEALDRKAEALTAWDSAITCNAGFGQAFTRRSLLLLEGQWGPPPPPRPPAPDLGRRLALTRLGSNGRFGNQILQYGVARLYAERHGLTLETPPWIGRHLFGLDDPLPGPALPRLSEERAGLAAGLAPDAAADAAGHDIDGYFCGDTGPLAAHADAFRRFFTEGRRWRERQEQVQARLRQAGDTIISVHLRRGDFGWGPFWISPESWYLDWLDGLWPTLRRPVLYIATDDPRSVAALARYQPLTAADLYLPPVAGADFLDDFQALCAADILAISNSTFSFTAGLLNDRATGFLRPDRALGALAPYHPWASPVLLG